MRIAQINSCSNIGSTGRIAIDLGRVIDNRHHESLLAYGRGSLPNDLVGYQIGSRIDLYTHVAFSRLTDRTGFASTCATRKLLEKLNEFNPDIIHLHNIHGYYVNISILFEYIKQMKIRTVWTFHDCWPFTGHCPYFDFAHCNKWKSGCDGGCPERNLYPQSLFISQAKRNYEEKKRLFNGVIDMTIVTPSHWLANQVSESYLSSYPLRVIPNGVDQTIFRPRESDKRVRYNLINKKIVLAVANYWSSFKGYDDILFLAKHLGSDYQIVMIGLSSKQMMLIPNNIIGIEHTSSVGDLADWYAAADVLVNPTYVDNFPTINIEALSCGTPVITYQTGGSCETADTDSGVVVLQGDLKALYKAVCVICAEQKLTDACLQRARLYNKDRCFSEYINLYENYSSIKTME